jgi:pSer/pThr/pTyr-binding forkhead associated (FHA) protein
MKLRLQLLTPHGSATFAHSGPIIRIGRDPACELPLQGEVGRASSWHHARIELAAESATLTDTGSSNGTLLNERLVDGPRQLRTGDQIQLGRTGASLKVIELSLPAHTPANEKPRLTWLHRWFGRIFRVKSEI